LAAEGVLVAALEDGTGLVSEERMQGRNAHEISMVVGGKRKMRWLLARKYGLAAIISGNRLFASQVAVVYAFS
jgi:hypothetical protein